MRVVFERQASQFELARALNVDAVKTVNQDVGDSVILQQGFQWAETENLVQNLARETFPFGEAEGHDFAVDRVANNDQHFVTSGVARRLAQFFQVKTVENLAMQVGFYLLVVGPLERLKI